MQDVVEIVTRPHNDQAAHARTPDDAQRVSHRREEVVVGSRLVGGRAEEERDAGIVLSDALQVGDTIRKLASKRKLHPLL